MEGSSNRVSLSEVSNVRVAAQKGKNKQRMDQKGATATNGQDPKSRDDPNPVEERNRWRQKRDAQHADIVGQGTQGLPSLYEASGMEVEPDGLHMSK